MAFFAFGKKSEASHDVVVLVFHYPNCSVMRVLVSHIFVDIFNLDKSK